MKVRTQQRRDVLFDVATTGYWDGYGTRRVYWVGVADRSIAAVYVPRKPKTAQWIVGQRNGNLIWFDPAQVRDINSR